MNTELELQEIELTLEDAKKKIELGKALDILENNVHFKLLFTEKYLNEMAINLVMFKSSPVAMDEKQAQMIENKMIGIGQLKQFLMLVKQEALGAEKAIEDNEQAKEEILAEEG